MRDSVPQMLSVLAFLSTAAAFNSSSLPNPLSFPIPANPLALQCTNQPTEKNLFGRYCGAEPPDGQGPYFVTPGVLSNVCKERCASFVTDRNLQLFLLCALDEHAERCFSAGMLAQVIKIEQSVPPAISVRMAQIRPCLKQTCSDVQRTTSLMAIWVGATPPSVRSRAMPLKSVPTTITAPNRVRSLCAQPGAGARWESRRTRRARPTYSVSSQRSRGAQKDRTVTLPKRNSLSGWPSSSCRWCRSPNWRVAMRDGAASGGVHQPIVTQRHRPL